MKRNILNLQLFNKAPETGEGTEGMRIPFGETREGMKIIRSPD